MPLNLFKNRDDSSEFRPILAEIEEDPSSPLGQMTFWLVIAIVTFTILWSIFGQVDVVVTARGKAVPVGEIKVLQPLTTGVVRQINVKEGDYIKKGQELIVIDPAATEPMMASYQENLRHLQAEQARLNATSAGRSFGGGSGTQRDLYNASRERIARQVASRKAELQRLNAKIAETRVDMAHSETDLQLQQEQKARLENVRDLIARDQYQKVADAVLADQSHINQLAFELEQLEHQKEQTVENIDEIESGYKADTLTTLSDNEKRISEVRASAQQASFQNARQRIVSPVDGYVQELFVNTVGGVVTPAEKLVSIVPANTPVKAEVTVMNQDIGYVKEGLPVRIKLDTFEFQKYGTLNGRVQHIPKDSTETEKMGPIYKVDVTPLERSLKVNGRREYITSGMSLTAEIKVGKRRIIEFFLYPLLKHWQEGMSVR